MREVRYIIFFNNKYTKITVRFISISAYLIGNTFIFISLFRFLCLFNEMYSSLSWTLEATITIFTDPHKHQSLVWHTRLNVSQLYFQGKEGKEFIKTFEKRRPSHNKVEGNWTNLPSITIKADHSFFSAQPVKLSFWCVPIMNHNVALCLTKTETSFHSPGKPLLLFLWCISAIHFW